AGLVAFGRRAELIRRGGGPVLEPDLVEPFGRIDRQGNGAAGVVVRVELRKAPLETLRNVEQRGRAVGTPSPVHVLAVRRVSDRRQNPDDHDDHQELDQRYALDGTPRGRKFLHVTSPLHQRSCRHDWRPEKRSASPKTVSSPSPEYRISRLISGCLTTVGSSPAPKPTPLGTSPSIQSSSSNSSSRFKSNTVVEYRPPVRRSMSIKKPRRELLQGSLKSGINVENRTRLCETLDGNVGALTTRSSDVTSRSRYQPLSSSSSSFDEIVRSW